MLKKILIALAALCALAVPAAAQSDAEWQKVVDAAKKEGKVVVYTATVGSPYHKAMFKAFEEKYGIHVELLEARASEVRERVRIEQAAGRFAGDIHHNGSTTTWLMTKDGNFQPHGPLPNLRNLEPPFEAEEMHFPSEVFSYGLLVNRNLVKPADEPKSWKDLLDPKWKGKILSDDMRALGGGAVFFVVMHNTFGQGYHDKLAAQKLVFSRDIPNMERRVARGEFPFYIPFGLQDLAQIKSLPVKAIVPAEGRPYIRFDLALLKNAPHPNAAQLLMNFWLEADSQLIFANGGYNPVVKGVVEKSGPDVRPLLATKALGTTIPEKQDAMLALAKQTYK
ncbi:MAG: ABC transporter substrate-binding protein [Reyranellales bacterium]